LGDPKVIYQNFGHPPPPLYAYHVYVGIKKCFGLLKLPPKTRFRLAASAAKLAAAATATLPPPRCHRHAATAYTDAALMPSCRRRRQAGRCPRASAATAIPFVSIVIAVAVITAVSVFLVDC